MRILLVEDDKVYGPNLEGELKRAGHQVVRVETSPEALRALGLQAERDGEDFAFRAHGGVPLRFDGILLDQWLKKSPLTENAYDLFVALGKAGYADALPPVITTSTAAAESVKDIPNQAGSLQKLVFGNVHIPRETELDKEITRAGEIERAIGLIEEHAQAQGVAR